MAHRIEDEKLKAHLDKSQRSLITAINEVRHISHQLRPSALDDIGLEAALSTLLQDFHSHSGMDIDSHFDTEQVKLKSEVATTLYRVAQESLNNIEKHAKAKGHSNFAKMGNMLQLLIRDDGTGFMVNPSVHRQGIDCGTCVSVLSLSEASLNS